MGAQISADVRSRLDASTLEDLLSDDKFVEELEQKLVELESKSQKSLMKLLKRCKSPNSSGKKSSNGEPARLRPLWEIQPEDVAIPSEIAGAFETWKLDHAIFLQREFSTELKVPSSPGEHYRYTRDVQASLASDRILRRFLTTVYYDLVSEHSQSDRNSITKEGVNFVAAVIGRTGADNIETVKEDVSSWAKEGGKFRGLADAMDGLGCYFFFPEKLSEWIWLKYLTQEHHERATTLLREHGIVEKAREQGAQDLAIRVERSLRAPFEESVSLMMQVRQRTIPVTAMALAQQTSTNPSQPPADSLQPSTSSPSSGGHLQTSGSGSSSYSSAVHTPPSLEISSQSSDARRWSEDTDTHRPEQPILGQDQVEPNHSRNDVEEIEVINIDNTLSSRALDSFGGSNPKAIPRLAANGLMQWQLPPGRPRYLILLLHALGGSLIPESMFLRTQLPQARWNNSGAECWLTGPEAGLDQPLINILSNTDRLLQSIRALKPFVKSSTTNGSQAFFLKSQFQSRISQFLNNQEKEI